MFNKIDFTEFAQCIEGILDHELVLQMMDIPQHGQGISCYHHCLYVSFVSYAMAKRVGVDFKAAARGAMLHDLYLTRWEDTDIGLFRRLLIHPKMALENAKVFNLSAKEEDIIVNHMWPLTPALPKSCEAKIVSIADKICAAVEFTGLPTALFLAKRMEVYMQQPKEQEI